MSSDDDIIDWGDLECTVGASEWCGKECDPVTAAGICPEHVSTQIIASSFVKCGRLILTFMYRAGHAMWTVVAT